MKHISVTFSDEMATALKKVADRRGMTRTEFIRECVRSSPCFCEEWAATETIYCSDGRSGTWNKLFQEGGESPLARYMRMRSLKFEDRQDDDVGTQYCVALTPFDTFYEIHPSLGGEGHDAIHEAGLIKFPSGPICERATKEDAIAACNRDYRERLSMVVRGLMSLVGYTP